MDLRRATQWLIGLTFAIWIAWDVYLAKHGGPTESMLLRDAGKQNTFAAHLCGFLVGHWMFPRQSQFVFGWMYGIGIWVALIAWDCFQPHQTWYRYEGFWVLIGILSGSLLWCQIDSRSPLP